MAVPLNFPADKLQMAGQFRQALYNVKKALENVADFRQTLYDVLAAGDGQKATIKTNLVNDYGFTTQEADDLVEAVEAEYSLRQVAIGQAQQVGNNDFFFIAKKYWGFNPR